MKRSLKIMQYLNSAVEGIKSIAGRLSTGTLLVELEKEAWSVYKDCESAVFLIKLEISDVEAPDNTALDWSFDRSDYAIFLAEDHLKEALAAMEKGELDKALQQARIARNIMAEVCSQVKKENLRAARESWKKNRSQLAQH